MRIISGKYKGRKIEGYNILGTRPTMDRVKESLFAMIQDRIKNGICLDLFAGSGSLGLEAISNGSKEVYFIDSNDNVIRQLNKTINNLKVDNCFIMRYDYSDALSYFKNNGIKFDIIFLDPPYKMHLINDCLKKINNLDLLYDGGIIVCEFEDEILTDSSFELIKCKKYGTIKINIYQKITV